MICKYKYIGDSFHDNHECELPEDHKGPHQATVIWWTYPIDICRKLDHLWSEWEPFPHKTSAVWKVLPDSKRQCRRCYKHEYFGGEYLFDFGC